MFPLRARPLQRAIRHGQQRHIWDWAVANPVAVISAGAAVVAVARALQLREQLREQSTRHEQSTRRAQEVEKGKLQMESELRKTQDRERQLELQVQSQATRAEEQVKHASELRTGKTRVETLLQEAVAREGRLQSITERGQHGERVLKHLLGELTSRGYAQSFELQPEIAPGKWPDAVVTLLGGKWMVVDSKAPRPPSSLLETGCENARREYVSTLKRHISDLGSKHYHATEGALSRTWLLLPGEGYLQAAYAADGSDSGGLHEYAAERAVSLVGPNGLRSVLQHHALLQLETEASERLEDDKVQARLRQLQPAWTESVLPRTRAMGKDLKKLVATFNELGEMIKSFDVDLRARDVLDLPKVRKTSLPVVVGGPADTHLEPDTVHTHSPAAPAGPGGNENHRHVKQESELRTSKPQLETLLQETDALL